MCLIFCIDGNKVDKYCDYGIATISNDITPATAWLSSENSEKYFSAEIVDSNNLPVVKWYSRMKGSAKFGLENINFLKTENGQLLCAFGIASKMHID